MKVSPAFKVDGNSIEAARSYRYFFTSSINGSAFLFGKA